MRSRIVIYTLLILLAIFQVGCFPPTHVGKWVNGNVSEAMIFHEDGTFEMLYLYRPDPAPQLGQPVPEIPDKNTWKVRFRGTYVIEYSKDPAWIDLIYVYNGTQRRTQGLIKFPDDNTFYVAFDNVRPASIENSSRKARFTRAASDEIKIVSE